MPTVAVVCGSRSDLPTLKGCFDVLDEYGIGWEASVISAHRQAETLHAYVDEAEGAGCSSSSARRGWPPTFPASSPR